MARFTKADAEGLREHFATEAADAGLKSPHGALVDMAMSGIQSTGRRSYESAVTDYRFGPTGTTRVHARIRARLAAMADGGARSANALVLFAAYGPSQRPWHPQVKSALKDLGSEIGVAMLTDRVQKGFAGREVVRLQEEGPAARPSMLVWIPRGSDEEKVAAYASVIKQAARLLQAAHHAYAATGTRPRQRRQHYREGIPMRCSDVS